MAARWRPTFTFRANPRRGAPGPVESSLECSSISARREIPSASRSRRQVRYRSTPSTVSSRIWACRSRRGRIWRRSWQPDFLDVLPQDHIDDHTPMGGRLLPGGGATFRTWAPAAQAVYVLGTFNDWT